MHSKYGITALIIAAMIAIATAVAHISCLYLGPACYQAQLAPPEIVQSAMEGTLLAPVGTLLVSFLFFICALYALSAAGLLIRMPLLGTAICCISALCILRGLATLPLSYVYPEMLSEVGLAAGAIWFTTGLLFMTGYRSVRVYQDLDLTAS